MGRGVQSPAPEKSPWLSPYSPCESGPSRSQALWPHSDCLSHHSPPQEGLHPVLSTQALPCLARLLERLDDSMRKNGVLRQPHLPTLLQTQANPRVGAAILRGCGGVPRGSRGWGRVSGGNLPRKES